MSNNLEGYKTNKEALLALKTWKPIKVQIVIVLLQNFFKKIWRDLGCFLSRSVNFVFDIGEISVSQTQGIISTCIPPKGG